MIEIACGRIGCNLSVKGEGEKKLQEMSKNTFRGMYIR